MLIYGAFRLNYRAARIYETVELSARRVEGDAVSSLRPGGELELQPLLGAAGAGRERFARQSAESALARPGAALRQFPQRRREARLRARAGRRALRCARVEDLSGASRA